MMIAHSTTIIVLLLFPIFTIVTSLIHPPSKHGPLADPNHNLFDHHTPPLDNIDFDYFDYIDNNSDNGSNANPPEGSPDRPIVNPAASNPLYEGDIDIEGPLYDAEGSVSNTIGEGDIEHRPAINSPVYEGNDMEGDNPLFTEGSGSLRGRRQQQECRALGDRCSNGKPCCDKWACTDGRCIATTTPNPTPSPTNRPTSNPTLSPTSAPTNAPTNPQPTTSPTTKPPTEPVTCLCCLNSPGFGDYFKLEQGGYLEQGTYGDGSIKCTSAFLTEGTNTLDLPMSICNVEMLLIGGGGGGGGAVSMAGGGGGAGEVVRHLQTLPTTTSKMDAGTYTIEIGQGGAGGASGIAGLNGGITSIYGQQLSIRANGGGGGGSSNAPDGKNGGSGGGAGGSSAASGGLSEVLGNGMGNSGGTASSAGAGGGGATGLGESASGLSSTCFGDFPGDGGPGVDLTFEFGKEFNFGRFAGGGAGGASRDFNCLERTQGLATDGGGNGGDVGLSNGSPGKNNSGGGGGGGSGVSIGGTSGGSGGSGIIIIKFNDCLTSDMF